MLKIKDSEKKIEIAKLSGPGQAVALSLDHLQVKMFRVDLFPILQAEITVAHTTEAGDYGPSTQFLVKGEAAEALFDKAKLDKFVDHLEDFVEAKCPIRATKKVKP